MSAAQILALLLAVSLALNVAFVVGITAHRTGLGAARAALAGAGVIGTVLGLYFAAVAAYR